MSGIKLYSVSDGPPSMAVRMLLKALKIDYELKPVIYNDGEHLTEEYYKLYAQKEVPVLDDNGFILGESNAILQYLADKYDKDGQLYPKELEARALVHHRLCFNLGSYYKNVAMHTHIPIFFMMERTQFTLKMVNLNLETFNEHLRRQGFKYAAANHVTIADFALVASTLCLEAINFDLSPFPLVAQWYETFKKENPLLWKEVEPGMQEIHDFEFVKPPDTRKLNHPYFIVRRA